MLPLERAKNMDDEPIKRKGKKNNKKKQKPITVSTIVGTECAPNDLMVAIIQGNSRTDVPIGRKYFQSDDNSIDDGIVEFTDGKATVLVNNRSDEYSLIKRDQVVGSILNLDEDADLVDVNPIIGMLATKHEIRTEMMYVQMYLQTWRKIRYWSIGSLLPA